ncbi:MAG: NPCBM/NEW2 domain-containing protein [Pirellulaceae bacterium]
MRCKSQLILVIAVLLLISQRAFAQQAREVKLLDQTVNGTIVTLNKNLVTLERPARSIPISRVISIGELIERANRSWVILKHGEVIVADQLQLTSRAIRIRSLFWEEVEVDWNVVRAVIRNVPKVHSSRDRLIGEVLSDPSNSFVVFDQQTRIDANIRFSNNGDVLFESPGLSREIVVPFGKTRAVVVRGLGKPANFMGIVGFSDGSFGAAVDVIRDGDSLKWKTSSGVTLTSAEPLFNLEGFHVWSQLHYFRPVQDSVIYLDSLEPTSAMTLSLFDGELGHRSASSERNDDSPSSSAEIGLGHNVQQGRLRQAATTYLHGIGMKSLSRVSFNVPPETTEFQAELALDSRAGKRGSVTYHVFVKKADGDWTSVFASPVIRGSERPVPLRLNVEGVEQLALVVGMADRATIADYANWLDARFLLHRAK